MCRNVAEKERRREEVAVHTAGGVQTDNNVVNIECFNHFGRCIIQYF